MKKILLMLPILGMMAACDTMTPNQQIGTVGGAAVGALVTPNNPVQGAAIGGAVGLLAGTYIGRASNGSCLYQRPDGSRYTAHC
ncbi:hypothetical protein GC209_03820 [bacterium]|nr:hypothetical protein [bacterium]